MTEIDFKIFDKEIEAAILEWNKTKVFTQKLTDLFQKLIKDKFDKRIEWFENDEVRKECENYAILRCLEVTSEFNTNNLNRYGEKYSTRIYFSIVIIGVLHERLWEFHKNSQ